MESDGQEKPVPASYYHKIEIYKTFVDTAERNIERRMHINQFYYSLVAAIFVAFSYINNGSIREVFTQGASKATEIVPIWLLPLFLIIVSLSWFSILLSFRALSSAKYRVILELERELPYDPFKREWDHYKTIRKTEATQVELIIPIVFYLVGIFGTFYWFF